MGKLVVSYCLLASLDGLYGTHFSLSRGAMYVPYILGISVYWFMSLLVHYEENRRHTHT